MKLDCTGYRDKSGCYYHSAMAIPCCQDDNVTLYDKSSLMYNNTPPPCLLLFNVTRKNLKLTVSPPIAPRICVSLCSVHERLHPPHS